ncbi:MAG: hypothetical protein JWQ74_621 [Marmoricola sp.]|nr:hypothetical protein [Marmoricola sp.]
MLLVVAYHAHLPVGAGFEGVDIFFVISGFVITRMLVRKMGTDGSFKLRWFWAARVRRLLPALTLMTGATLLLSIPLTSPVQSQAFLSYSGIGAETWVANGVLALVTWGYFVPGADQNPFLHTWSLAVEEQFYFAFPILVVVSFWLAHKIKRRGWGLLTATIAAATALSFLVSLSLTFAELPVPIGLPLAFYSPASRAWEFGAGALVALLLQRWPVRDGWFSSVLAFLGVALVAVGLVVSDDLTSFPGFLVLYPVVGAALLVLVAQTRNPVTSMLSTRPLVYLGDISYGWYLYHWPLLVLLRRFWDVDASPAWIDWIAVLLALGIAALSYRYFEVPIRQRQVWGYIKTPRLAFGLIVLPVALAVAVLVSVDHGWWNSNVRSLQEGVSHQYWKVQQDCQDQRRISERDPSKCRFPGTSGKPGFILLGDSNAGVYADVLVRAGAELNRTVTVATIPSCELTPQRTPVPGFRLSFFINCRDRYDDTMRWLAKQPPSIVLVASGQNPFAIEHAVLEDPDGTRYVGEAAMIRGREADLVRTYREIRSYGHTVVPIAKVPHLDWKAAQCTFVSVLVDETTCGRTEALATSDADDWPVLQAQSRAASVLGLQTLDFRRDLCPDGWCRTNVGDTWNYEDGGHLTYGRAMELLPTFVADLPKLGAATNLARPRSVEPARPGSR